MPDETELPETIVEKVQPIQSIRGMADILPKNALLWQRFEANAVATMHAYNYEKIQTPILEHTQLFRRGIGNSTDIVEKEMYSFSDALNGDHLSLRPENTAGVVRAVIEHHLLYDGPKRLWYQGPMFRHERPQKGRYRQFHQLGAEAIGWVGPDIDVELIMIGQTLFTQLGVPIRLEINTLGSANERRKYREALQSYLQSRYTELDDDAKRRFATNPLRILDTKNPQMRSVVEEAPQLTGYVEGESMAHFEALQSLLVEMHVPFRINPRLVRGLDYYNATVFEWITDSNEQPLTVCGGGRYDALIELLGGPPAPACGFAVGVERVLALMSAHRTADSNASNCDVYLMHYAPEQRHTALVRAMLLAEMLRKSGLRVLLHCGEGAFKQQFKRARSCNAAWVAAIGEHELSSNTISLKPVGNSPDAEIHAPAICRPEEAVERLLQWKRSLIGSQTSDR